MKNQLPNIVEVLIEAYASSGGKTVNYAVDHDPLPGVTVAMFQWWGPNITGEPDRYKMWYPEDHINLYYEDTPDGKQLFIEEKFGEYPAALFRVQPGSPDPLPIEPIYAYRDSGGYFLGPEDQRMAWLCHEYEDSLEGMKLRSTFIFPAKTPKRYMNAFRKHCKGEMWRLTEFLPDLFKKETAS